MSVLVQTSYGDLTIDLFTTKCPTSSKNFLKLCKLKHYNNALFINVQKDHLAQVQTSNPTTIYKEVFKDDDYSYFEDEIDMEMKLNRVGLLCTTNEGSNMNNSEFFITLTSNNLTSLHGKHTVYGEVQDGLETLKKINQSIIDKSGRPILNIRILHTHIIDDPFQDLPGMRTDIESPLPERDPERLEVSQHQEILGVNKTEEEMLKITREKKAKKQAVTLEILGDLPDADAKPAENILFVCKLNPITVEKDLELIFSRYGNIKSCEIVRDWKTGQSLQYAFIEYETPQSCEEAYLKMQRATIDNRRIEVDFSQSVRKLMPKLGKKTEKRHGELREKGAGELVPKYREGREIYGEKSSKYDLLIGERKRERRQEEQQPSRQEYKRDERSGERQRQREREREKEDERLKEKVKEKERKERREKERSRSRSRSHRKQRKHSSSSDSSRSSRSARAHEKKAKDKKSKKTKKHHSRSRSTRKQKSKKKHHRD